MLDAVNRHQGGEESIRQLSTGFSLGIIRMKTNQVSDLSFFYTLYLASCSFLNDVSELTEMKCIL